MIRPFDTQGKTAVVATMHGKERAIIPALAPLGLALLPRPPIDTDHFGTFMGSGYWAGELSKCEQRRLCMFNTPQLFDSSHTSSRRKSLD